MAPAHDHGGVHPGAPDDPNDTTEPQPTTPPPPDDRERQATADDEEHGEMEGANSPAPNDQSGQSLGEGLSEK